MDRVLKAEVTSDLEKMVGYGTYDRTIDTLVQAVSDNAYIAGSQFTAADVYVGSHIMWGMEFGSIPKRTEFEAYVEKLANRPALAAAKALDDSLIPQ